jgi:A/G-specific adenine glycosylase
VRDIVLNYDPGSVSPRRRRQSSATASEISRARELSPLLEDWFAQHGRSFPWRSWKDPYRVCIAEILLQRTSAEAVAKFVGPFLHRYSSPGALLATDPEQLRREIQHLGLASRRVEALRLAAAAIQGGDDLTNERAYRRAQYIPRAIAVSSHGARVAMVDANFVRVIRRVFGGDWMADYRFDRRLQELAQGVVEAATDSRAVNWAILDLGATTCRPGKPLCDSCPLRALCQFGRAATGGSVPLP